MRRSAVPQHRPGLRFRLRLEAPLISSIAILVDAVAADFYGSGIHGGILVVTVARETGMPFRQNE